MATTTTTARVGKYTELEAVVFPPCVCGQPYNPSRPIVNHGIVHFQSKDWLANLLWRIEGFIQRLRKARLQTL